jgi:hypothetical protein
MKGRDEDLHKLAKNLQRDGQPKTIVQGHRILYGLGGIGKTCLAVEYAWRFGSRYRATFFVRAESPERLSNELATLAHTDMLDLPERKAQNETVQAVLHWLKTNPGWLLILDNVDSKEAKKAVLAILPALAGGHILITSRLRDWPKTVYKQALDTISQEEAQAFLLKRTENERRATTDDEAQAWQLAEKLDGLPLALEQAGAYIAHTRLSFSEYLKVWEEETAWVLEWRDEAAMGYPASVAATLTASFDRLTAKSLSVLRLATFLGPGAISFLAAVEFVQEAVTLLVVESGRTEDNRGSILDALAELENYSLISRQEAFFSAHRLAKPPASNRRAGIGDRRSGTALR